MMDIVTPSTQPNSPDRIAVIMAGGSGERFWPLSRPDRPKQLLKLTSPDETMLEEAVNRISPLVGDDNVYVATSSTLHETIRGADVVPEVRVLAEPLRRNTLGCLVWVAASLLANDDHGVSVAVLTADHKINEPEKFRKTVEMALETAERTGGLVTIGIRPDRPETGYGYVEYDPERTERVGDREAYASRSFREKPDLATAESFVSSGNFLWNAGMFFYTLDGFLRELEQAQPEAYAVTLRIAEHLKANDNEAAVSAFEELPNLSIDYALMEKAKSVFVVPSDFPWDDVGAWDSLERSLGADDTENVRQGSSTIVDGRGNIVVNDRPGTNVGIVGLNDIIVVVTEDAVLVCPKSDAQRVKEIVKALG